MKFKVFFFACRKVRHLPNPSCAYKSELDPPLQSRPMRLSGARRPLPFIASLQASCAPWSALSDREHRCCSMRRQKAAQPYGSSRKTTAICPTSTRSLHCNLQRAAHKVRTDGVQSTFRPPKTKPHLLSQMGFRNLILTMTYSHMGKPHTTIGDASFHC